MEKIKKLGYINLLSGILSFCIANEIEKPNILRLTLPEDFSNSLVLVQQNDKEFNNEIHKTTFSFEYGSNEKAEIYSKKYLEAKTKGYKIEYSFEVGYGIGLAFIYKPKEKIEKGPINNEEIKEVKKKDKK